MGESPLNMMRPENAPSRRQRAVAARSKRRRWPVLAALAVVVVLAVGWCVLWYYAASVADRTLAGWVQREAAAGRVYGCETQGISGFPFRIEAHCAQPSAALNRTHPPFAVTAKDITFTAEVFEPTLLRGDITAPLTLAELGQPPSFIANWSRARISVRGLPPQPDRVTVTVDKPSLGRAADAGGAILFKADDAELDSRIVSGSPGNNPVIEAVLRFTAAAAPTFHPLLAQPLKGHLDATLRGFKDLLPKPWAERFREMQAAGGNIEIKSVRIERADAIIVGTGTLTVNEHGKLDGLVRVAIVGLDRIIPQLGIDRVIAHGIDRLAGASGQSPQGLNALDRLMPGLSGVVRDSANANIVDNLNKMGQPTEIDKKPGVVLPLRFADGSMYLGMLPVGEVPPLF